MENMTEPISQSKILSFNDLLLQPTDPKTKYRRRNTELKTAVHWGQRKLFLNELLFLTLFASKVKNPIVLYVGAAPGKHIPFIASLFPMIEWHLYDPAVFTINISKNIHIYQDYFTNKTAEEWSKKKDHLDETKLLNQRILFISDIRSADPLKVGSKNFEEVVSRDMKMQQDWYLIVNPAYGILKFRLPYPTETLKISKYLFGYVFKQPWAPQTSTETRLIPMRDEKGNFKTVDWDLLNYEQQLFHFNTEIREKVKYSNILTNNPSYTEKELIDDYDSGFEIIAWQMYLKSIGGEKSVTSANVISMSNLLTSKINDRKPKNEWDTLKKMRTNPYRIKARNANRQGPKVRNRNKHNKSRRTRKNTRNN